MSQDAGWNAVDAGAQDCGAGRGHVSGVHVQVQEVRQAGQTRAKAQGCRGVCWVGTVSPGCPM